MKRFVTLLLALLFATVAVNAQQPYEILLTINGDALYSDANGDWLTREGWKEKYGKKDFRANFPYPNDYVHAEEYGYVRTYFSDTFKPVIGGDMEWSRVLESSLPINLLKRKAASNMDNVTYEDETSISGVIFRRSFTPDHNGRLCGLDSYLWNANVTYEFREGRYKVTLSNIECVNSDNDVWPLVNMLYIEPSSINIHAWWIRITNILDRTFTAAVILSSQMVENDSDNDW